MMKRLLLLSVILLFSGILPAQQVKEVIQWVATTQKTSDSTIKATITASMKEHWHIYTATPGGDGTQIPTVVKFDKNASLKPLGKMKIDGKAIAEEIKELEMTIHYYKNKVSYSQEFLVLDNTTLNASVNFQICDEEKCLQPTTEKFALKLNGFKKLSAVLDIAATDTASLAGIQDSSDEDAATAHNGHIAEDTTPKSGTTAAATGLNKYGQSNDGDHGELEKKSLFELFLAGLVAGFIAFIMPCIYAMLPITVSFFTKRSKTRAIGIKNAIIYSLSIIFIFTAIGGLISMMFGPKTMYELSSSMGFNLFVFVIFIIFGVSLLGAFEITLPSSWSSKLDSKANSNSMGGIFFMALVLVVVSFSCTSAFISSLIVYIVKSGNSLGGVVGFFGFGLAIALPFAMGALFPGMMNNIAKSGGWLNSVKVTMGFLELAMAMKFLSNIDLQYHWGLLDFEIYLSIWIVIFTLLGLYLLGKIKFSHDEDLPKNMFGQPYLSVTRLFFAMIPLAFVVYMIPGLWGAPLSGISGFLPERKTLDFNLHDNLLKIQSTMPAQAGSDNAVMPVKYADKLKSELPGIPAFFDYQEALEASKKTGKPVLLDFTGHSCVNCRKMERAVLSKPDVLRELNQHFILASLYCDDKTPLAEADQYVASDGSKITTLGAKNLDLQFTRFGSLAQPLYIFVDADGNVIKNAGGYDPNVARFMNIIKEVKEAHKKH
jgi:thiol:disulfide interchange protein